MWRLVAAFLLLNVGDCVITHYLLEAGGIELNPLLQHSDWMPLKMLMALAAASAVVRWDRPQVMLGLVIGMLLVVAWNAAMAALLVILG